MQNWGIGDFDTRVRLQRCRITAGDNGEKIYNWQCVSDVFAKVERDIDEVVDNGNLEQGQALTLTMWKVHGLTTRWRVIVGGVPCSIEGIDPVSRLSPVCRLSVRTIE